MLRLLVLVIVLGMPAQAQTARLAVSVDCPGFVPGCDVDFFQTEVPFARFVRDQGGADVAVLITQQATGGGGRRYDLSFRGRRGAQTGRLDTLTVQTAPAATDDAQRRALLGRLALGLAGYAARTGLADQISIAYTEPEATDASASAPARDPWNGWVFEVDGNARFNGEQRRSSLSTFGSVQASRVTDRWKVSVRPRAFYERNAFVLDDGETRIVANSSSGAFGQVVRAATSHVSVAVRANAEQSTFENIQARLVAGPAAEYNVFDYAEATQRQLRFTAGVQGETVAYVDTTLFGRIREVNLRQTAGANAVFAQPWGSTDLSLNASHILTRPDKYRIDFGGNVDFRILQGLNAYVFGRVAFIRDQINLRGDGASDEDVLTAQRQLATGYDYRLGVGMSYTFGSIFNPVVNARFGN